MTESRAGWKERIPTLLDRLQPSETAVLFGTAIAVGAGTGIGAVVFIRLISLVQSLFFDGGQSVLGFLGLGLFVLAPAVGGLLAGPIIAFFATEAKGHGVPEVMQAIAVRGGRIRPRVVIAKVIASALCIGSGGSAGREGPIVQVGAALGSTIGQWLRLSQTRVRNLVACGAAAGIAATFNAPIAGVVFAMEIILGEMHLGDLGNVVISAVTSATVARIFLGDSPAFAIPRYGMKSAGEVLLFVVLGLLSALAAVGFIRLLYWFEDRFDNWRFPGALKPAVGGILLGGLSLVQFTLPKLGLISTPEAAPGGALSANLPLIFGSGFPVIGQAVLGQLPMGLLLALVLLKPLATSLTLGSGNSGGVFAPSLFIGAALGGAFGHVVERLMPGATAGPGAFAIVGMAAVFAGAAHAPFTAILIVFEMTDDYRMILPLMAGVVVSMIVSEKLHRESIYTLKLLRRGIHLQRGSDLDVMETVRVEEVMVRQPVTVSLDLPVADLAAEFLRTGRHGFPVIDSDGNLFGVVSLEDYRRVSDEHLAPAKELKVREIATRDVSTAFPDETVGAAMRRMAPRDLSRLPVVDRENPRRLVGVVRRNDIVRAYEIGAVRREQARELAAQMRLGALSRTDVEVVAIAPSASCVGKKVGEVSWPRECIVATIRRGKRVLIPHGDTLLNAGDELVVIAEEPARTEVRRLCAGSMSAGDS
jgi:chloride channel protein, CIC family